MSLLSVDKLVVSYGDSQVLIDVGFDLERARSWRWSVPTAPARPRCCER